MRKQTWLAIIVCVLAVIPSFFIGGIVSTIYLMMTTSYIGPDPDVFFLRMFFGIETPGLLVQWIFFTGFPAFVQGLAAGWLAVFLTALACPGANIETAAYSTGTLYTGLVLLMMALAYGGSGLKSSAFQVVTQLIGVWSGLIPAALSQPSTSAARIS